jgi:hypothetical protein
MGRCHAQELTAAFEFFFAVAIAEEAVVADALEAIG